MNGYDREVERLEKELEDGIITYDQFKKEMRELNIDYQAAADMRILENDMTDRDPYNESTCRGSIMLGSACGHCPKCLKEIADMEKALSKVKPKQQAQVGLIGWSCPVCGRGNAPYSSTCPCVPMPPMQVTC